MKTKELEKKLEEVRNNPNLFTLHEHKALGDYVLVVPAEIKEAGITTRHTQFEDRPDVGIVVAVGSGVNEVKEGNVVFFGEYSHFKMVHNDITYLILREEDIICVAQ